MAGHGELQLIRRIRSQAAHGSKLRLGIGDDCAVIRPPAGHDLLVTTDFSLEGRHFRRDLHPAHSVGHRCLARGLSDLAAMGGKPLAAFLSLALPAGLIRTTAGRRWVDSFFAGLLALGAQMGAPLAGGDTATAPGEAILADITLLGSAPRGTELRRSGARAGDALYVTGALGGSAAELAQIQARPKSFRGAATEANHPHLFPAPRLREGNLLRGKRLATAAIDLSDGPSTDLRHLCDESGVGAVVDAAALPLHPLLRGMDRLKATQMALHGGEDYELLFTARPKTQLPRRVAGTPVTRIGTITRSRDVVLLLDSGERCPLERGGWEHSL